MMVSRARTLRRGSAAIVVLTAFSTAALAAGVPDFSDVVDQIHHGHAAEAYADLQRLAEIGDTRAQYFLGVALIEGKEVPQDLVRGYAWIEIAAECGAVCTSSRGVKSATDARVRLSKYLDGRQLIEAERIADAYLAPRREQYHAALEHAAEVLAGEATEPPVTVYNGCALQRDLEGCTGMPKPDPARPSCVGPEKRPWKPPSTTGPLARVRQPRYPMQARQTADEGRPSLVLHVDHTGYVCQAAIARSSGNDLLDAAAIGAAIRWRLQPAMEGNQTAEAIYPVTVDFGLSELIPREDK